MTHSKRRERPSNRGVTGLWSGALIVLILASSDVRVAIGQVIPSSDPDLSRVVLQHLSAGDIAKGLAELEQPGDQALPIPLGSPEPLSTICAALHRALAQLPSDEQYDLLRKWTLPAGAPARVRVLTSLAPTTAPPPEFARALGERPRANSFSTASVGQVPGIYCTAWSLVSAARDCERLPRLIAELEPLVQKKVPNAELIWCLAQIADEQSDMTRASAVLTRQIGALKALATTPGAIPASIDSTAVALACAGSQRTELRVTASQLCDVLQVGTTGRPLTPVRSFLRQAGAIADLAGTGATVNPRFNHWIAVSGELTGMPSSWLAHDEHLLHLAGNGNDSLLLKYPLQGEFQFRCDIQIGPGAEGGVTYGGKNYRLLTGEDRFGIFDSNGSLVGVRGCPFVQRATRPIFHPHSISVSPQAATIAVKQHPMWTDSAPQNSPWIGMTCLDERRPLFRNISVAGQPTIPRSVPLVAPMSLPGWKSRSFAMAAANPTWRVADSSVRPPTHSADSTDRVSDLLSFGRPLQSGESVSYEFLDSTAECEVCPALGRVVFVIRDEGVRIRWLTDGGSDWTGLAPENSVVEPLNRRGPRPLNLKAGDWHRVTVSRNDNDMTLSLDDTVIYQRPIDWPGDCLFGLHNESRESQTVVQNVVLTGNWPESLPEDFHREPFAMIGGPVSLAARQTLNQILGESFRAENIRTLRTRTRSLPVAERFAELSRWILPGPDHGFQVTGDYLPIYPAEGNTSDTLVSGNIASPVFDWIEAARELGLLAECRQKVEQTSVPVSRSGNFQERARAALLLLISTEQNDVAVQTADAEKLYSLIKVQVPDGVEDQWPEMMVASRGVERASSQPWVSELIGFLQSQRSMKWVPETLFENTHVESLQGRLQLSKAGRQAADAESSPLSEWIPVTLDRSGTSGVGFPRQYWDHRGNRIDKLAGHDMDFLLYRLPLSGNYEFECIAAQPHHSVTQILLAGRYAGLRWDCKSLDVGTVRGAYPTPVPPITHQGEWVRYRGVVRDGVRTLAINGQQVLSEQLPENPDPWLGIRSWGRLQTSVKDLRVTGRPTVLDAVSLSHLPDLTGWSTYYDESAGGPDDRWIHVADPDSSGWIVGRNDGSLPGSNTESLLRYQRPLIENGSIDYDFYYNPKLLETHPALDHLVFLLHPSGVREHWITNGRYERADLDPDNSVEVVANRRGPETLPLKPRAWNHLSLVLKGTTVSVVLNGQGIYERPLEPSNRRFFGLFHYVDKTSVRVRNVVMRGDWPKTLPPVASQEAAGLVNPYDADRDRLKATFVHDFAKDGLPDKYFRPHPTPNGVTVTHTPEGIHMTVKATGVWTATELTPRFSVAGDFDIEVQFDKIKVQATKREAAIILHTHFDDPRESIYGISRVATDKGQNWSQLSQAYAQPGGGRSWQAEVSPCGVSGGRMRLSRRGTTLAFLFAEEDSDLFHLFHTETVPDVGLKRDGVRLHCLCNEAGDADVIWKSLTLRAEKMTWFPEPADASTLMLRVLQADGKQLRTIFKPDALGMTHLGSPEWSADGRRIALDVSNGSVSNSHVVVINADGTGMKDLGPGCMPSFSPDGSRIVYTNPGRGIVTMKADGTDSQVIDASGWGTQWSPDGKWIAYLKSANITLMEVATKKTRQLLVGEPGARYSSLFWSLGWSNDSRSLCFKARRRDSKLCELAVVDIDSPASFKVLHASADTAIEDFMWTPDDQQVVVSLVNPAIQGPQLYTINRKQGGKPQLLPAQPASHKSYGYAWSRDGKWIALASTMVPQPVEWLTGPVDDSASR